MAKYIKQMNVHIPEKDLYLKNGNVYIKDTTYEEARAICAKFAVPTPLELRQTKYMEQTYSNKAVYKIDGRYYILKKNRNTGDPYLHLEF
jgi:hypothetical protein